MEIDSYSPQPEPSPEPPGRSLWPYAVALLVIILGVAAYLLLSDGKPPPPPTVAGPPPPAAEQPADERSTKPLELPRLGDSDDWLRRVVAEISTHPDLARWLVSDNLVRRFTAAVDNVANGESPRPHLGFLAPATKFETVERDGALYPAPRSYERYNRVTEVIDSIDAAGAAELYRQLRPLLQEGYADLGYPGTDFDAVLGRAIDHLLATPLSVEELRIEPGVESYSFSDARFEGLSPAQKHLLRTGPDNAAILLDKLREIAELLDLAGG